MKRYILTLALTPLLFFFACMPAEREEAEQDADSLAMAAQEEMREFRSEVDESLADIDTRLDSLEVLGEDAGAEADQALDSTLASLRQQRDAVQQDLQELETATEENFEDLRADIETELDSLEQNVEEAWARFADGNDNTDPS